MYAQHNLMFMQFNSSSIEFGCFPENLIVNYGEVNRQSDCPTVKQESHPPDEPTGKSRDRVGSSGCLHPEPQILVGTCQF